MEPPLLNISTELCQWLWAGISTRDFLSHYRFSHLQMAHRLSRWIQQTLALGLNERCPDEVCMKMTLQWHLRVPSIFSSAHFPFWSSSDISDTCSVAVITFFLNLLPKAPGAGSSPLGAMAECAAFPPDEQIQRHLKASTHQELPGNLLPVSLLRFLVQQGLDFGESLKCISYGFKSISIPFKVLYPQHIYDYLTPRYRDLFGKTLPEALILQT